MHLLKSSRDHLPEFHTLFLKTEGNPISDTDAIVLLKGDCGSLPDQALVRYSRSQHDHAGDMKQITPLEYMDRMEAKAREFTWCPIAFRAEVKAQERDIVSLEHSSIESYERTLVNNVPQNLKVAGGAHHRDRAGQHRSRAGPPWMRMRPTNGHLTISKEGWEWTWCSRHAIWCNHTIENCMAKATTEQTVVTTSSSPIKQEQNDIDNELHGRDFIK